MNKSDMHKYIHKLLEDLHSQYDSDFGCQRCSDFICEVCGEIQGEIHSMIEIQDTILKVETIRSQI